MKATIYAYAVVDDLELIYDTPTSVKAELNGEDILKVHPNSVNDLIHVEYGALQNDTYIQIYDAMRIDKQTIWRMFDNNGFGQLPFRYLFASNLRLIIGKK